MSTANVRWGVIGVGRAGQARVRAIARDPRAVCVGGLGGAPESVDVPRCGSLAALLDACDAVAVCSPDATHRAYVLAALRAKKHVICEFPLAASGAEAAALFHLAATQRVVLHVEHIELLGPAARWIRGRCVMRRVESGSLRFTRPMLPQPGSLAHANVARLHRLVDAVGMPHGVTVLQRGTHSLRAQLDYGGEGIALDFRQEPDTARKLEMSLRLSDGWVLQVKRRVLDGGVPVSLPETAGLFDADQLVATASILDGSPSYVSPEQVVERLGLADQLLALEPVLPPDERPVPRR